MPTFIVTIDGPSASGKSTVAKRAAGRLGFVYVDSGSLYRAITWQVLREGRNPTDPRDVAECLSRLALDFRVEDGAVRFKVNGTDPGAELRSTSVHDWVSDVSAVPQVRERINTHLREMTRFGSIVMEGRDIGSVVFPDAPAKFYLDASPEERARRRHHETASAPSGPGVAEVMDSLRRRDTKDRGRRVSPLRVPEGATIIDTTHMAIDEVVDAVVAGAQRLFDREKK